MKKLSLLLLVTLITVLSGCESIGNVMDSITGKSDSYTEQIAESKETFTTTLNTFLDLYEESQNFNLSENLEYKHYSYVNSDLINVPVDPFTFPYIHTEDIEFITYELTSLNTTSNDYNIKLDNESNYLSFSSLVISSGDKCNFDIQLEDNAEYRHYEVNGMSEYDRFTEQSYSDFSERVRVIASYNYLENSFIQPMEDNEVYTFTVRMKVSNIAILLGIDDFEEVSIDAYIPMDITISTTSIALHIDTNSVVIFKNDLVKSEIDIKYFSTLTITDETVNKNYTYNE